MSGDTKQYKQEWIELCEKGELICGLCLKKIEHVKDITYDHWMPRALGGHTTKENGVPAHPWCNSRKGCIPPDIFVQHREEILSGTYKLEQPYSLHHKPNIRYGEPVITTQNGHEVQKTHKRSYYQGKPKSKKQLKKEEKQQRKQKRTDRKRKFRKERKKFTKTLYKTSYKLVVPAVLDTKDITLGQTVGQLRKLLLGDKVKFEVARYVVIGFVDGKPIARELVEKENKQLATRLIEVNKPIDYTQAKIFARRLNSYLNQRRR